MKPTSSDSKSGPASTARLNRKALLSRRAFLQKAAGRAALPAVVAYSAFKMTPPAFGASSGGSSPSVGPWVPI